MYDTCDSLGSPIKSSRGVHQTVKTVQTVKIASKSLAKWHNRTGPQVILRHTAWCSAVCGFIIRKPHKPHASFYILIYLIIFNIKYIINSLISLVFLQKKIV